MIQSLLYLDKADPRLAYLGDLALSFQHESTRFGGPRGRFTRAQVFRTVPIGVERDPGFGVRLTSSESRRHSHLPLATTTTKLWTSSIPDLQSKA
jgi:hypothetical protein